MFTLGTDSRVFVLCPPRVATGGPESLHLLVRELGRLGHDAAMAYLPPDSSGTPDEYASYGVPIAATVEDAAHNLLIVPEIWSWRLRHYPLIQKAVWWLSVDNYLATESLIDFGLANASGVCHLVASAYAEAFVRGRGATRVESLSGYVHQRFLALTPTGERDDVVAFNPKKGMAVIERLRRAAPDLAWRALDGLSRDQLIDVLCRAQVYVDFGHHPGKERLPREAALAGCCIVTGRRGSAAYDSDLAIAPRYKLDDSDPLDDARLTTMLEVIRDCVRQFATRQMDFAIYREGVRDEKRRFEESARRLFGRAK